MRRIWLLALAATAIVVFPASALSSGAHHKQKSGKKSPAASYKSGIYSGSVRTRGYRYFFGIRLAHGKASLNQPPALACGAQSYIAVGDFAAPAALSASGSVTEHARYYRKMSEETPITGTLTFTLTFTKHGTGTGDFEASLMGEFRREPFSCNSGKVPFTAKLRWTLAGKPIERQR